MNISRNIGRGTLADDKLKTILSLSLFLCAYVCVCVCVCVCVPQYISPNFIYLKVETSDTVRTIQFHCICSYGK